MRLCVIKCKGAHSLFHNCRATAGAQAIPFLPARGRKLVAEKQNCCELDYRNEGTSAQATQAKSEWVQLLEMVDNSISPRERISGWFSSHATIQIGYFIL
jgi:hypothetical protein